MSNYTSVTLPYNGTVTLSNASETIDIPGADVNACPARGFTFNVSDGTGIKISLSGDNISCVLSSSRTLTEESEILMLYDEDDSAPFSYSITTKALEAGEYTLFVNVEIKSTKAINTILFIFSVFMIIFIKLFSVFY